MTLGELLVVIALIVLLIGLGAAAFQSGRRNSRNLEVRQAARMIADTLTEARARAIARNRPVAVVFACGNSRLPTGFANAAVTQCDMSDPHENPCLAGYRQVDAWRRLPVGVILAEAPHYSPVFASDCPVVTASFPGEPEQQLSLPCIVFSPRGDILWPRDLPDDPRISVAAGGVEPSGITRFTQLTSDGQPVLRAIHLHPATGHARVE